MCSRIALICPLAFLLGEHVRVWAHASRKLRQGSSTQVLSQVTDQSVFAAGFFRSIEEFCARRRARAAWRGIVILVIHQSYQSRDLAPDLARNCVGDVDTITVGATLRLSIDAAGLLTPETRRGAAQRYAFVAVTRAPQRRKFSGGDAERRGAGRELDRVAGRRAPVNAEMRALSQRHRKLPLREQGLPQRRRLPGLPTGRRRPRSLASMACSLRAPRSRCTDAAARRDH